LIDKVSRARVRNEREEPRTKEKRLHFAASSSSDVPSV
jgi:hypothetical protein